MTLLAPDPIDFDDTWVLLESSLITILQDLGQGFPSDLWISLYTGVYKLCTKPMDPQHSKLYGRLKVCSFYVVSRGVHPRGICSGLPFCCCDRCTVRAMSVGTTLQKYTRQQQPRVRLPPP